MREISDTGGKVESTGLDLKGKNLLEACLLNRLSNDRSVNPEKVRNQKIELYDRLITDQHFDGKAGVAEKAKLLKGIRDYYSGHNLEFIKKIGRKPDKVKAFESFFNMQDNPELKALDGILNQSNNPVVIEMLREEVFQDTPLSRQAEGGMVPSIPNNALNNKDFNNTIDNIELQFSNDTELVALAKKLQPSAVGNVGKLQASSSEGEDEDRKVLEGTKETRDRSNTSSNI